MGLQEIKLFFIFSLNERSRHQFVAGALQELRWPPGQKQKSIMDHLHWRCLLATVGDSDT